MENENVAVALYQNNLRAKHAIKKLQKSGYDMKKLSVVGKDFYSEENVVGFYKVSDRKFLVLAQGSETQLEEARKTLGVSAKMHALIANE